MSIDITITSSQVRSRYLDYFASKGHYKMPSSSLVPHNDPTVLLTTAGMQQMISFFWAAKRPPRYGLPRRKSVFAQPIST